MRMKEPVTLINSGIKLEKGKRYKAEVSFLVLEDMDANLIYEVIAQAIVRSGGGRTIVKDFIEINSDET
jgi:hypothetical protein